MSLGRFRWLATNTGVRTGLFGNAKLREPKDWLFWAEDAIRKCTATGQAVALTKPSVEVIQQLDDISDTVCQVYDAAELCRNVHSDALWRAAAHETCTRLGGFIHELNNSGSLYTALVRTLDHHEKIQELHSSATGAACEGIAGFTREAILVGRLLRRDFEVSGIHLGPKEQEAVTSLTASIHQTGFAITSNIAKQDDSAAVGTFGRHSAHAMLHDRDESIRKQGLQHLLSTPEENVPLLEMLAAQRNQLAKLMGAESYATYWMQGGTLAQAPEAVVAFMQSLSAALQPQIEEELARLRQMKQRHSLRASRSAPLQPWDQEFCKRHAKKVQADIHRRLQGCERHFQLRGILQGLAEIVRRTFQVTVETVPLQEGEGWAADLAKLSLTHETEGPLGNIYLDLFRRPDKFAGCAHFTLRCKRQLADGMTQLPLVALVFNFRSQVLEPAEAETFFHEFGHAMHSLFSQTQFQHLAGTRGPLDMIEIPSHFFEHFIRSRQCLELCTVDPLTGAQLPSQAAEAFQHSLDFMPVLRLNDSIIHAMMDQSFHGVQTERSQSAAMAQVVESLSAFHPPFNPEMHWHIRLGHLVNYGASYYSYVYAKFIADAIWREHFQDDPFSQAAGAFVRTRLLDLGGAKEPKALIDDLLGPGSLQSIGGGWAPAILRL